MMRREDDRDEAMEAIFDVVEENVPAIQATLFFHFFDRELGPGNFGIHSNHSTFALIEDHAERMNELNDELDLDAECPDDFENLTPAPASDAD